MLSPSVMCRRVLAVSGVFLLTFAAGCQTPAQPTMRTSMVLRVADYDQFWDESLSLLRRHDFAPEFIDRAQGLAISQPATSGQWFEFWRSDSRGLYNTLESSLHTMRRVVTMQVEPLDGLIPPPIDVASSAADQAPASQPASSGAAPRYRVVVRVDKSRYSAPERQVTTASGALGIYSERLPTTEGLRPRGYTVQWTPLGRDDQLEKYLLDEIRRVSPNAQVVDDPAPPVAQQVADAR